MLLPSTKLLSCLTLAKESSQISRMLTWVLKKREGKSKRLSHHFARATQPISSRRCQHRIVSTSLRTQSYVSQTPTSRKKPMENLKTSNSWRINWQHRRPTKRTREWGTINWKWQSNWSNSWRKSAKACNPWLSKENRSRQFSKILSQCKSKRFHQWQRKSLMKMMIQAGLQPCPSRQQLNWNKHSPRR